MNIFKRVFDFGLMNISPRRYAIRKHCERMEHDCDYRDAFLLNMRVRGYRAAKSETGNAPWIGRGGSADAEILHDLPALRIRSRELGRDDSIGSGLIHTFITNIIGAGMTAQARTGNPEKNKLLESVWRDREDLLSPVDDLTHGETQRLIMRKVLEDGECLRKAVYDLVEPVWFETIEAERVATPPQQSMNSNIRDGVERDPAGRPIAYHIIRIHPGDNIALKSARTMDFVRIEKQYIRHLKITDRPGQTRGVPFCHAILQDLRDLDLLILAALKRTQIAACLAGFVKSEISTMEIMEVTAKQYGYVMDQAIVPGMLYKLYPGEEITTLVPNFPSPELIPFIIMIARRIAAALGVSWQVVLKDFSQSSYSSARTDLLETRQTYQILQAWLVDKYFSWEWKIVMEDARLHGDMRLQGITDAELGMVQWIPPGWQWVDPENQAKAAEIELRIGTETLRDLCSQKGRDWEELQDQRLYELQREMIRRKELGLPEKTENAPVENESAIGRSTPGDGNHHEAIVERMRRNINAISE